MVKERMDLLELLRKRGVEGDVDFLREALRVLVNLARISSVECRSLTVEVDGAPAEVELAFWWEPEPVGLAHIMRDGDSILATSIGVTHVELLCLLKTMAVLQRDSETLAGHQQEHERGHRRGIASQRGTLS